MRALTTKPGRAADWDAATKDPESVDWIRVFAGYGASVGSPGTAFWREIVDAFPDAKVILTRRDPQKWYDSAARTMSAVLAPPPLHVRLLTWRPGPPSAEEAVLDSVQRLTWEKEVGDRFEDREHTIALYERHIADVRAYVPADRLLEFEVRDGWGPLCEFLGVPVPDEPFPRENDTATFLRRQRTALRRAVTARVITMAGVAAAVAVALAAWAVLAS
jgi:hypothetical protein